ncbi:MAG: HD domain-containing protein [bacterium]
MFKLIEYRNCLEDKKTPNSAIHRRIPFEQDEDNWMGIEGDDFSIDAFGKIITSKAYRRLGHKTQVLTENINAHVHDRQTHTNDVANVATFISKVLGLNADLCQAIALGHDIGHVPFGHRGEGFISKVTGKDFLHSTFGVIIAQHAERHGEGLNLSHQVLEGILFHSGDVQREISEEAKVVKYSDKISFTLADFNDVFRRTRILDINSFPQITKLVNLCGNHQRERLNFLINGLCKESAEKGEVSFETSEQALLFKELKSSMYEVYHRVNILNSAEILEKVYSLLSNQGELIEGVDPTIVLALMTDDDVLHLSRNDCVNGEDFYKCSVSEIVGYLKGKDIDFSEPDLNW